MTSITDDFNPTLVRFKPTAPLTTNLNVTDFNPTLVRFKRRVQERMELMVGNFNPTLVRFKLANFDIDIHITPIFQSYLSQI